MKENHLSRPSLSAPSPLLLASPEVERPGPSLGTLLRVQVVPWAPLSSAENAHVTPPQLGNPKADPEPPLGCTSQLPRPPLNPSTPTPTQPKPCPPDSILEESLR